MHPHRRPGITAAPCCRGLPGRGTRQRRQHGHHDSDGQSQAHVKHTDREQVLASLLQRRPSLGRSRPLQLLEHLQGKRSRQRLVRTYLREDGAVRYVNMMEADVAFAEVQPVAGRITPNPGGVGPMTIAMLLANTVTAAERATR